MSRARTRRFELPSVLVVTALVVPTATACTARPDAPDAADVVNLPDTADVAAADAADDTADDVAPSDAPPDDAADCAEVCRGIDPTTCSAGCGSVVHGDAGSLTCSSGNPECVPMTTGTCCCCIVA
jgi:hypothetical protein